jgi:hypothetical protein
MEKSEGEKVWLARGKEIVRRVLPPVGITKGESGFSSCRWPGHITT